MVNNVSFGNGFNVPKQYSQDIENVVKYTLGTNIVNQEGSPFSGMGLMLGIGGGIEAFKGGKWLLNNRKNLSGGWQVGMDAFNKDLALKKGLFGNGGWKSLDTYKNLWNQHSAQAVLESIPEQSKLANFVQTPEVLEAKVAYERAAKAAKLAKASNGARSEKLLAYADSKLAKGRALTHGQLTIPKTGFWGEVGGFFGKVGRGIGKYTGMTKASGYIKNLATESPTVAKLLKFGKGNGIFLAITGAIELFTQVIPTFSQLGAGKGMKQLGKSTVKTAANVGGWVAGAAAGAAIGSIIPGAGTIIGGAIGALCGLAGGMIGSWGATKLAETVVGKNELDIAKDEQAKLIAAEISKNPQQLQELMAAADQKLKAGGQNTPDGQLAFGSMTKLAANMPNSSDTSGGNNQQYQTNQYAQNNQANQNYAGVNPFNQSGAINPYAMTNPYSTGVNNQFAGTNQFTGANQYAAQLYGQGNNMMGQQDYKDLDFMSMNAGLLRT